MGFIVNIDRALKERSHYNILKEPLHKMMKDEQEAWEKSNPIDLLFVRGTLSSFQETYTSSIGFDHAFSETSDFNVGPIFNQEEGFAATYRTRTFQGGFIITQQAMEDNQIGKIKDDASKFGQRWRADVVEYAMKSLEGGFGKVATWGSAKNGGVSKIVLNSADTVTGDIMDTNKNPLFTSKHTIVKREGMTTNEVEAAYQTNLYSLDIDLAGDVSNKVPTIADAINQVITNMENLNDDNGKLTGVVGQKTIVTANDPHLKSIINTALAMDMFNYGESKRLNPAYKRATYEATPYLNKICDGKVIFIVDKSYNESNHGLEFTERIPFTLEATELKRPWGVAYDGRQRFDINVATWRGISAIYLGNPTSSLPAWASSADNFTKITVATPIATPVRVVNASEIGV